MPPPEKVIRDKRRQLGDDDARREIDDATRRRTRRDGSPRDENEDDR
jgi:hypothetical protein